MSDYKINKSITENDIPKREPRASKYDGVYRSCGTLEIGEGIHVTVHVTNVATNWRKALKKRHPNRHYSITQRRKGETTYDIYIIRKQ